MGLFDKLREPVFLKRDSGLEIQLEQMKKFLKAADNDIKKDVKFEIDSLKRGIEGEKEVIFQLEHSYIPMYVLRDISIVDGINSAQIDFIVITRKIIFIIECKNLSNDVRINELGNFIIRRKKDGAIKDEGILSPVEQNRKHMNVVRELCRNNKNTLVRGLFEKDFDDCYKSLVVFSNSKNVLYPEAAPEDVKNVIVKVDSLASRMREEIEKSKVKELSDKKMKELAEFFLSCDNPKNNDYTLKYKKKQYANKNEKKLYGRLGIEKSRTANKSNGKKIIKQKKDVMTVKTDKAQKTSKGSAESKGFVKLPDIKKPFKEAKPKKIPKEAKQQKPVKESGAAKQEKRQRKIKALREYRDRLSVERDVEQWMIFDNDQIESVVNLNPKNIKELKAVKGFKDYKAQAYGEEILKILRKYK